MLKLPNTLLLRYIKPPFSITSKVKKCNSVRSLSSTQTAEPHNNNNNNNNPNETPKKFGSEKRPRIEPLCNCEDSVNLAPCSKSLKCQYRVNQVPVFIRTYGCQMNVNDTSIVGSILQDYGYKITENEGEAEVYLLMTCAIRDSAESKIWTKLYQLKKQKENNNLPLKQIGLLGCMAERLKEKVLQTSSGSVDIVAGPDSYRDLPRLFAANKLTSAKAINCLLSFDETYSDIRPVTKVGDVTAFVSITRGCDNLCSYCIVPFTRGRERSRPIGTIIDEVKNLMVSGIREVTLLGQNVNSYRDLTTMPETLSRFDLVDRARERESFAEGFKTVYKPRTKGLTFDVLLEEIAKISPELRVRFTSPHPKDFTNEVIEVIAKYPNISRCIHLPAQSGSDKVLERMRRGYTKEAYLELVRRMKSSIPGVGFTSDFIAGFCGETEEDHQETLDLIKQVGYTYIFSFPYSMRDKTHAYHRLEDSVDRETKNRRTKEILDLFRSLTDELNGKLVGTSQLVLIDGESRRSSGDWRGRVDLNIKTILPKTTVYSQLTHREEPIKLGDYVVVGIEQANAQTLIAKPLYITSQAKFNKLEPEKDIQATANS